MVRDTLPRATYNVVFEPGSTSPWVLAFILNLGSTDATGVTPFSLETRTHAAIPATTFLWP